MKCKTELVCILLILLQPNCANRRDDPAACRTAKCLLNNEWFNVDERYTPEKLNESGACSHDGQMTQFEVDWSPSLCMHKLTSQFEATKLMALREIEHEYIMMCEDAHEGCSLKRRLRGQLTSTLYWHQCQELGIEANFKQGLYLESIWMINNNYQPIVVAPLFFICHTINVVVLKKMLVDDKVAIVFQLSEVLSDMASCLLSTMFPTSFHVLAGYCTPVSVYRMLYGNYTYPVFDEPGFGDMYHIDRMPTWEMMLNAMSGFQIANQLFNLYLLICRWYCLTYPTRYMQMAHRKTTSLRVVTLTVIACILVALWPAPPIHMANYKANNWRYMWHMYPWLKDSALAKLLIETKGHMVVIVYGLIIAAQGVFSVLFLSRFRAFLRSKMRLLNETEQQAQERKTRETDKALLMICTLVVNWICMMPTVMVMLIKSLGIEFGVHSGTHNWLAIFSGLQLLASGFNAIGAFGAHILFTKSYRKAFSSVFLGRCCNSAVVPIKPANVAPNAEAGGNTAAQRRKKVPRKLVMVAEAESRL